MSAPKTYPVRAPGWAALDRAVARAYPGLVPHQFASQSPYDPDSTAPLPAVVALEATDPDHWHLVTYGLTELFEKSSPHEDRSGFGFELTFRIPRGAGESRPPAWPVQMLQALGHHILFEQALLDTGHVLDLGGSLRPDPPSRLRGLVCVPDPDLGKIDTPHGSVLFLQLFGLTEDEVAQVHEWELVHKVGLALEASPRGITDPDRGPLAESPRTAPVWRRHALGVALE